MADAVVTELSKRRAAGPAHPARHPQPARSRRRPSRTRMALAVAAGAGMAASPGIVKIASATAAPGGPGRLDPAGDPAAHYSPGAHHDPDGQTTAADAPTAPPPPVPAAHVAPAAHAAAPSPSHELGTFLVTCYSLEGGTATGAPAGPESVAVDPSVIPLGTRIEIAGVGVRVADDTGGSIHGHRLDIWEPSTAACNEFGRRWLSVSLAS